MKIYFRDQRHGWVEKDNAFSTTDGGNSWAEHELPIHLTANAMHFSDNGQGLLMGETSGSVHGYRP